MKANYNILKTFQQLSISVTLRPGFYDFLSFKYMYIYLHEYVDCYNTRMYLMSNRSRELSLKDHTR